MTDILVGDLRDTLERVPDGWRDISEHGSCFRRGDPDAVGSLVCLAWEVSYNATLGPLRWAWAVERVNKTGRTELRRGRADSVTEAQAEADMARRRLAGPDDAPLWGAREESQ